MALVILTLQPLRRPISNRLVQHIPRLSFWIGTFILARALPTFYYHRRVVPSLPTRLQYAMPPFISHRPFRVLEPNGKERDTKLNENSVLTIPMTPDTTWTCGYQQYFQNALDFLLPQDDVDDDDGGGDRWVPDLVIVCAGYDALDSDELASVSLNANDFGKMTRTLLDKIRQTSNTTGLLLGLEGGYQLSRMAGGGNLQQAVVETVKVLFEDDR